MCQDKYKNKTYVVVMDRNLKPFVFFEERKDYLYIYLFVSF